MRVLVFGVEKWLGIARLPKLLRDAGFTVGVLSAEGTFLGATRHRDELFTLRKVDGPTVLKALGEAVDGWGAGLIIPGDDSVLSMLQEIVAMDERGGPTGLSPAAVAVVRRSLPSPRFFDATTRKLAFAELCAEARVPTPEWRSAITMADLLEFAEEFGYPVVVKTDLGVAGAGVYVCQDEDALAKGGYATLSQFKSHGRVARVEPVVVQRFIQGPIGHYTSVSWEGALVAGAAGITLRCHPEETGPSTVIQFVEAGQVEECVGVLASLTRFTGFASHDYIVEEGTGKTYLIECNPRPVAATSACIRVGVDLGAALYAKATGGPRPRFFLNEGAVVALYPQEVVRDPESEFLKTAIVDRPDDDEDLLAAYEAHIASARN
jgi:hypothetical protein